ncbi:MAG: hypothetical protein ABSE22_07340 [Xanthobacteraceae bacterium]
MRVHLASAVTAMASIVLFSTSLCLTPVVAAPIGKLAPNEIQATFFSGQPFTAATKSNVKFKMMFSADGKMKREPAGGGGGAKGTGTWQLSKDGFCTAWSGAKANCFTVVGAGDNKWSIMKGSTVVATWSK